MKVGIIFADGFEDIEAITPFDILKRGGVEVISLGLNKKNIKSDHGLKIETDFVFDENFDTKDLDCVVLPGGLQGAQNLRDSKATKDLVVKLLQTNKKVGAICASPALALSSFGVLNNKKYTCYPGMQDDVKQGTHDRKKVVIDENLITSQSVGTAMDFSYELLKVLTDKENADKVLKETFVSL